jgi:hypothetical protein
VADNAPEWITATGRAVHRASDAVQAQEELKALSIALKELKQVLETLEQLAQASNLGRGSWWSGLPIPASLRAGAEPTDGDLERRQLAATMRELKQFTTRARNSLEAAWCDHVDSQTGDTTGLRDLVDLLAVSGHLASVARDLQQALSSLQDLRSKVPDASSVQALADTLALSEVFEAALPNEVKRFISAAARGGASIALLSTEVLTWLGDNGAIDNFKVIAGKPQGVAHG